ncbi:hypothetical protein LINGRAHAP2_LOCUS3822, partial [Linum grandiflorum]
MNFLVLHFLDMVNLDGLSPSFTPTCGFWDNAKVARAWKKIKGSEGKWSFRIKNRGQVENKLTP